MNDNIRLIDTHTHLHSGRFDADREAVLRRAAEAGVVRMIEIGYDLPSSRAAIRLAEQYPHIYAVVGIQPHYAADVADDWIDTIASLAAHPKVVAIGEIGLDYYHDRAPHELQHDLFRHQLAMARDLRLPVVIHSRDAQEDTIALLRSDARGQPGIMHSFSGDWQYAAACLDVGFHLSFSGPLTFAKAHALHDAARRAPIERLLIETDSPYLAPHPLRGRRNEPANVRLVAARLAELRDLPLDMLADAVWQNAAMLFSLPRAAWGAQP
ncbi:MAG TPA: TatD family hydrolase [Roseiflexaceae bacterium]|nr:TatD family hydrolase [Roseiflexaceae bacterium]